MDRIFNHVKTVEDQFETIKTVFRVEVYADGTCKNCVRTLEFDTWDEVNKGMAGETLPYIISIARSEKEDQ